MVYLSLAGCIILGAYDDIVTRGVVFSFLATYTPHDGRVIKSILIDSTGRCNNKARRSRKGGLGLFGGCK